MGLGPRPCVNLEMLFRSNSVKSLRLGLDTSSAPCDNLGLGPTPYNPLGKDNLGISVREALLSRPVAPMKQLLLSGPANRNLKFFGAGVYAIYYLGDFPSYQLIAQDNRKQRFGSPIYVGKAVPKGASRGGIVNGDVPSDALFLRLRNHAKGIDGFGLQSQHQ